MVAVTETSAAAQSLRSSVNDRLPHPDLRPATPAVPASDAAASADPAQSAPRATPTPIGFALHYDNDLRRLILEARVPVSGYLIVQIPPKYVVKQFSAQVDANLQPSRGASVNTAI